MFLGRGSFSMDPKDLVLSKAGLEFNSHNQTKLLLYLTVDES